MPPLLLHERCTVMHTLVDYTMSPSQSQWRKHPQRLRSVASRLFLQVADVLWSRALPE